jgi:hypothetical protein
MPTNLCFNWLRRDWDGRDSALRGGSTILEA